MQNHALAALGMFVFVQRTIPFQSLTRETAWSHPTNSIVGGMPKTQFTGRESDNITISGRLAPEITGGELNISLLRLMGDSGRAYPLINGSDFTLIGFFVIEQIHEERTELFADGTPRIIDFSMQLKRTDDPMLIDFASNLVGL